MRHATLTDIIKGLTAPPQVIPGEDPNSVAVTYRRPMFVCPILAKLPGVTIRHDEITPHLYVFLRGVAPELIRQMDYIPSIMDRWLNYAAFKNHEDGQVREMLALLKVDSDQPHILKDNAFKVKFYTYLLERHGDVGFDIP